MDTDFNSRISKFLDEVEIIHNLHRVMMDCISYHLSTGKTSSNLYYLAEIIQEKFKNLQQVSDKIYLEIYK